MLPVTLLRKDFSGRPALPGKLQVEQMSWSAVGGPDSGSDCRQRFPGGGPGRAG